MLDDAIAFWNAIKDKVLQVVRAETAGCMRCAVYEVTEAPSGGLVRVRRAYGNEITVRCGAEFSGLQAGDEVLVVWYGTLSTAFVFAAGR